LVLNLINYFSGAYRGCEKREINFSSYATVLGTATVLELGISTKQFVIKYKPTKCTFSAINHWLYNIKQQNVLFIK